MTTARPLGSARAAALWSLRSWPDLMTRTTSGWVPTLQRSTLGLVMLPHGLQKSFGWFEGFGFGATMDALTGNYGIPWLIALAVIGIETLGAVALLAGFATRLAALGVAAVMIGAIFTVHLEHGFFMNWFGNQAGEGFEYHLLALALAFGLVLSGGGRGSLDRALRRGDS